MYTALEISLSQTTAQLRSEDKVAAGVQILAESNINKTGCHTYSQFVKG